MTLRERIEGFIYPFLETMTEMVYTGGEQTVYHGVRVFNDNSNFTHGALVNAACTLYAYYKRVGDMRASAILDRLHAFIRMAARGVCKTWGKLAILRGFHILHREGLLSDVDPSLIELVKGKTEYDDFFDKETLNTRGMATNYMQVAMACAGMREAFGWESDGYAVRIRDKLCTLLQEGAVNGWLDDSIPYGRFDRYSLVLSAEFVETAHIAGLTVPAFLLDNLRLSAQSVLFLANRRGDGILYGRSVPIHGDGTPLEILSAAFAAGLIRQEEEPLALAYCGAVIDKILTVWYNRALGCFDMWWGGRGHDPYRPVERILETNLDRINHFYMQLCAFERGGVADRDIPDVIPSPPVWQVYPLVFRRAEGDVREVVFLRREDDLLTLPFVGIGAYGIHAAYFPVPSIGGGILEAAPQCDDPYLVPQYEDERGNAYLPVQYFSSVDVTEEAADRIYVRATGTLARRAGRFLEPTDHPFSIEYRIEGRRIDVTFSSDIPAVRATMLTAIPEGSSATVRTHGFASPRPFDGTPAALRGIHGALTHPQVHTATATHTLGYTVTF